MEKIYCQKCKKPTQLTVVKKGPIDQPLWKRHTKKVRRTVTDKEGNPKTIERERIRWEKVPVKPSYLVLFRCPTKQHRTIGAIGKSKADAHRAVNRLAKKQRADMIVENLNKLHSNSLEKLDKAISELELVGE